ncbi:ATP-binding protein [Halobacterium jilantaiense]|uniref:histidine kinase n=1 Tax=Halobacterium jilantaiense TaxID=355548 RepID=A0A1I0MYV7_9EURY|nr:ATP-binding protein [Halobacterium jilantaiense]SEV93295.1 Signal transduction histidine kinase [Halobacterium jilantaiense]
MALLSTLASVTALATASALFGYGTWRTAQNRERPSAGPLLAVLGLLTVWALFALGSVLPVLSELDVVSTVFSLGHLGAGIVFPGVWVVYALSYTGRGSGLNVWRVALFVPLVVPAVLSGVVLAVMEPGESAEVLLAPLFGTILFHAVALLVYGVYRLVRFGWSHPRIAERQVAVVTGGITAPYLLVVLWDGSVLRGTDIGLLASGLLLVAAVRRYPVASGFPEADHVARTRVVETLQEAVLVLDWDDHVLDVNDTTAEWFGTTADAMVGESVHGVVGGLADTDLAAGATGRVSLQTARGRRRFQYSVSAVTDASDGDAGEVARTLLLRDVTGSVTRQQRLTVLNRILRHNVRNNLDAALAYADRVTDDEMREGITDNVRETLDVASKARDAEEVMNSVTDDSEPVRLADVAATVADQFRTGEYAGTVSVTSVDEPVVQSHRSVVRRVLVELVENAFVHSSDSVAVEVVVRDCDGEWAEIVVADDGPGIPEEERAVLASGTETQLEHGHGIGLWFVTWAVTRLGGTVDFEENDPSGSVVTVRLTASGNRQSA